MAHPVYLSPAATSEIIEWVHTDINGKPSDFASWTVHFFNICVKNQQLHQLLIKFINYVW
jgi:hypothetical protein